MASSHVDNVEVTGQISAIKGGPLAAKNFPKAQKDFSDFTHNVESTKQQNRHHVVYGKAVNTVSNGVGIKCPAAEKGGLTCPTCHITFPQDLAQSAPTRCRSPRVFDKATWKSCSIHNPGPGSEHLSLVAEILAGAPAQATVLDIGSNEGVITLFMGAAGYNTIAFEAIPRNYITIQSSIIASQLEKKIHVVLGAVSDTCGDVVQISENLDGSGQRNGQVLDGGDARSKQNKHMGRKLSGDVLTIPTVRVDSLINSDVYFAKIDVEGSEPRAIAGMSELLTRRRVHWLHMEYAPVNMRTVSGDDGSKMLLTLDELGYDVYLEDCMHNILDEVKKKIHCEDTVPGATLVKYIRDGDSRAKKLHWDQAKIKQYTQALVDGFLDIRCCLVNILIHKRLL